ncbi:MAG TPA: DNA mismatch repair endonuclease MutL [Longimicrobiales bacterium]|nr:DNA mismatch repair endonuclease MutL [Longimicrobiales bacterium]
MARRILVLPDTLANQIAAGEVVERPASVVKELVENALDAAATRVDVVVRNGGKTEIRVADDGCGMSRDDALLALDRHATSKLRAPEDLRDVRTFGFRGEALPSIASVSRMMLETAEPGGVGTRVRVSAGRIHAVEDCARQSGTTVTVRNLFSNVPARQKFMRTAAAETRAIADAVVVLALANLSTAFRLESNDRVLLELPAAPDLVSRVAALWGDQAAGRMVAADHAVDGYQVAGLVERPDASLSGPRRVHLFVNGRPFRDRDIVRAAERAYRTTVPYGARPSLVLYLRSEPGHVDVNVHPAKLEVRFQDRAVVEQLVEDAIHAALNTAESSATLDRRPPAPQLRRAAPAGPAPAAAGGGAEGQLAFFVAAAEPGVWTGTDGAPDAADPSGPQTAEPAPDFSGTSVVPASRGNLWQIHETYILAETRSGLLIIDQHSAHERVLFQELMEGFSSGGGASQRLLFPLTLRLTPAEYSVVEASQSLFERAGFEIEPFGGRTMIVHAAPHPHPWFDAERCLREMIAELAAGSELTRAARNQHERIAMTFACKAAIKAGQPLTTREMEQLFDRLFATDLPYHDVHGRPTIVRLSLQELERRFGRHG